MTMTWAIVARFALQLPLAVLVGRFMKFGLAQPVRQTSAMPKALHGFPPAIRTAPAGAIRADEGVVFLKSACACGWVMNIAIAD
jgi:hypothetical protein